MAKGNDGNLLQHATELAAMRALLLECGANRFHLYCTHAMAPWEELEDSQNVPGRSKLVRALNLARAQTSSLPSGTKLQRNPIIDEYARLNASETHYPNTAKILLSACTATGVSLSGVLVDKDKHIETQLRDSFPAFRIFCGDWAFPMVRYRASDAPWLFAMAPPTFSTTKTASHLNAETLRSVGEHVGKTLVSSGHPGAVTIFCPAMDSESRSAFWNASVDALGDYCLEFVCLNASTANKKHVVAIMSTGAKVTQMIVQEVKDSIEGVEGI